MKNYYDELEVSKTASKETISKIYKILAKKYHPDTTKETDKYVAEEKFKAISAAYEILSDDEKRKKYDLELEQSNPTVSYEEYINIVNQRDSLNNAYNNLKNEFYQLKNSNTTNQQQCYNDNHIPYNQVDSNFNNSNNVYNNVNNYQNTNQNYNNQTTNTKKKTYYYTNTGKPASVFDYYKYRIREFFSNIGLLLLAITAAILIINAFSDFNLFSLFIK